jgi:hypothetical protein
MPVSPHGIFCATLFEEIAAETNRYISEKINEAMSLKKKIRFGSNGKTSQPKS